MTTHDVQLTKADIAAAAEVLRSNELAALYALLLSEHQRGARMNRPLLIFIDGRPEDLKSESMRLMNASGLLVNIDGQQTLTKLGLAAVDSLAVDPDSIISLFL